ncbi:MAG TPA: DUF3365 domain-containing protein [Gemmatimonadaceae bacterium]
MTPDRGTMGLLLLAGAVLAACGGDATREGASEEAQASIVAYDTAPSAEAVARARAAANGLGQELQAKLFAALDAGGPRRAVAICADSAQAWTARQAKEDVYVRRVSLRVRNPLNRPDADEARELRRLDSLHRAGALPAEVVRVRGTERGERLVEYVRPILVQERCLSCHGARERLAPGVRELLATRYPSDSATGYEAGDLRGMLSVRVRP